MNTFKNFLKKFNNDWCMNFSAGLSYSLLTAIVPFLIAILSVIGIIWGRQEARAQLTFLSHFSGSLGATSSRDIAATLLHQLSSNSGLLGIVAILLAIFAGSRLFIVIENSFDIIYQVPVRTFVKQNMMALGMLFIFIILFPIFSFTSSIPTIINTLLERTPLHLPAQLVVTFSFLLSILSSFILFVCIYKIIPNKLLSLSRVWKGSLFSAIVIQLYLLLFPLYAKTLAHGYIGQLGFAIVILVFFYYFSVILLLGAEINAFFSEKIQKSVGSLDKLVYIASKSN